MNGSRIGVFRRSHEDDRPPLQDGRSDPNLEEDKDVDAVGLNARMYRELESSQRQVSESQTQPVLREFDQVKSELVLQCAREEKGGTRVSEELEAARHETAKLDHEVEELRGGVDELKAQIAAKSQEKELCGEAVQDLQDHLRKISSEAETLHIWATECEGEVLDWQKDFRFNLGGALKEYEEEASTANAEAAPRRKIPLRTEASVQAAAAAEMEERFAEQASVQAAAAAEMEERLAEQAVAAVEEEMSQLRAALRQKSDAAIDVAGSCTELETRNAELTSKAEELREKLQEECLELRERSTLHADAEHLIARLRDECLERHECLDTEHNVQVLKTEELSVNLRDECEELSWRTRELALLEEEKQREIREVSASRDALKEDMLLQINTLKEEIKTDSKAKDRDSRYVHFTDESESLAATSDVTELRSQRDQYRAEAAEARRHYNQLAMERRGEFDQLLHCQLSQNASHSREREACANQLKSIAQEVELLEVKLKNAYDERDHALQEWKAMEKQHALQNVRNEAARIAAASSPQSHATAPGIVLPPSSVAAAVVPAKPAASRQRDVSPLRSSSSASQLAVGILQSSTHQVVSYQASAVTPQQNMSTLAPPAAKCAPVPMGWKGLSHGALGVTQLHLPFKRYSNSTVPTSPVGAADPPLHMSGSSEVSSASPDATAVRYSLHSPAKPSSAVPLSARGVANGLLLQRSTSVGSLTGSYNGSCSSTPTVPRAPHGNVNVLTAREVSCRPEPRAVIRTSSAPSAHARGPTRSGTPSRLAPPGAQVASRQEPIVHCTRLAPACIRGSTPSRIRRSRLASPVRTAASDEAPPEGDSWVLKIHSPAAGPELHRQSSSCSISMPIVPKTVVDANALGLEEHGPVLMPCPRKPNCC